MSKALAALARTVEPSLVFGLFSSPLAEPAVFRPSLALRFGMNRSAALCGSLMVVLPALERSALSFLDFSLEGVALVAGPVPVKVQSDTPSSSCFGDSLLRAILDLGELAYANFDTEREAERAKKADGSLDLWIESPRGGVEGEQLLEVMLVVRVWGDGVRGMRPPAVLVLKMP